MPGQGEGQPVERGRLHGDLLEPSVASPNPWNPIRVDESRFGRRAHSHSVPSRWEPYVPCSRRKRADADAVGKSGTVALSFERGAGSANPDAGDDCVVDGGLAFVSKHDELPEESVVIGLIDSVSTFFVPCRYAGWLMPLDIVLPVSFGLVVLTECGNQGPQGSGSDECLDNQIGGVYIDAKYHWMVTGLVSWGENSNSE